MERAALSVTQVNTYIQQLMDSDALLGELCVRGEISNFKLYPSGHLYFSLKDATGAIRCVMFKGAALKLRFKPQDGMKVLAFGKVSVFPRDGAYQLYCSAMTLDGVGDLYYAFEQLKEKLNAEGLFETAHKKPLPKYPGTIALITSAAGAAVHDMLRILRKRYPLAKVRIFGVRVQGAEAPAELCGAIRYVNKWDLADLIITGRGGGSMEDLWAFNDERLARVIYESRIPVISAVGHEPDVTISDYVADLRAATPSNAAELAVPDQTALRKQLSNMQDAMTAALSRQIQAGRKHLNVLAAARPLQTPTAYIDERRLMLDAVHRNLCAAQEQKVAREKQRVVRLAAALDAMSPLKVLMRGYAMAQKESGELVRSCGQVSPGDRVVLRLADGQAETIIEQVTWNPSETEA